MARGVLLVGTVGDVEISVATPGGYGERPIVRMKIGDHTEAPPPFPWPAREMPAGQARALAAMLDHAGRLAEGIELAQMRKLFGHRG